MQGNLASPHAPEGGFSTIGDLPSTQPPVPTTMYPRPNTCGVSIEAAARPTLAPPRLGPRNEQHRRGRGRRCCKREYAEGNKPRSNCCTRKRILECRSHCRTMLGIRPRGECSLYTPPCAWVIVIGTRHGRLDETSSNWIGVTNPVVNLPIVLRTRFTRGVPPELATYSRPKILQTYCPIPTVYGIISLATRSY